MYFANDFYLINYSGKIFILKCSMFNCSDCGNESLTWKGQCDYCKAWNTLKEFKESKSK